MERLTRKTNSHIDIILPGVGLPYSIHEIAEHYKTVLEYISYKLAEYEDTGLTPKEIQRQTAELQRYKDLEKEGRLITLPCKVGDTVYQLRRKTHRKGEGVSSRRVSCITAWGNGKWCINHNGMLDLRSQDLNKTWFLTKEAAEQSLKGD